MILSASDVTVVDTPEPVERTSEPAVVETLQQNPLVASLAAGVLTAILATLVAVGVGQKSPVLYIIAWFLVGAGPVIGYAITNRDSGSSIGAIIGGIISGILFVLGWLLWPILVGALHPRQSIGRLFLGSLLGIVLGVIVWFLVAFALGQDPTAWFGLAYVLLSAVWGGTVGAFLGSSRG